MARIRVGKPKGIGRVSDKLGAMLSIEAAEATVRRVQDRMEGHPASMRLEAVGVNQYTASIRGVWPGGVIRPRVKKALANRSTGFGPVAIVRNHPGLGPLVEAEGNRVTQNDYTVPNVTIQ